jgi:hypothetical protein
MAIFTSIETGHVPYTYHHAQRAGKITGQDKCICPEGDLLEMDNKR